MGFPGFFGGWVCRSGGFEEAVFTFLGGFVDGRIAPGFSDVHAFDCDEQAVGVSADDEATFLQVPDGELEVFFWNAEEVFKVGDQHGGLIVVADALHVEGPEHAVTLLLFGLGAGLNVGGSFEDSPGVLADGVKAEVVDGAFFGVGEDVVGVEKAAEENAVAGFVVIGMVALGEDAVDAMDGVGVGFGVELEEFVVVGLAIGFDADAGFAFEADAVVAGGAFVAAGDAGGDGFRSRRVNEGDDRAWGERTEAGESDTGIAVIDDAGAHGFEIAVVFVAEVEEGTEEFLDTGFRAAVVGVVHLAFILGWIGAGAHRRFTLTLPRVSTRMARLS